MDVNFLQDPKKYDMLDAGEKKERDDCARVLREYFQGKSDGIQAKQANARIASLAKTQQSRGAAAALEFAIHRFAGVPSTVGGKPITLAIKGAVAQ